MKRESIFRGKKNLPWEGIKLTEKSGDCVLGEKGVLEGMPVNNGTLLFLLTSRTL